VDQDVEIVPSIAVVLSRRPVFPEAQAAEERQFVHRVLAVDPVGGQKHELSKIWEKLLSQKYKYSQVPVHPTAVQSLSSHLWPLQHKDTQVPTVVERNYTESAEDNILKRKI
jgi:hypothetical protein